jgi:hypothetical protein
MARESVVNKAVTSAMGDLTRIAMSGNIARRQSELAAEKGLMSIEIERLADDLLRAQTTFNKKKEEFQKTTGSIYNLSDENRTPGFEKFETAISSPIFDSLTNRINQDREELATKKAQIEAIDELLLGPLTDITGFYTGAMTPSGFSGDPSVIDPEDLSDEALESFLGDKYKDMDQAQLKGFKTAIKARTSLAQVEAQTLSQELNTRLITAQNNAMIQEGNQPNIPLDQLEKNIKSASMTANSLLDKDYLLAQASDIGILKALAMEAGENKTADALVDDELYQESKTKLDNAYYAYGAILLGEDPDTIIEDELLAKDTMDLGKDWYDAIVASTKAKNPTSEPLLDILLEVNSTMEKDYINWDLFEEVTGYDQARWEREIPQLDLTREAIRVNKLSLLQKRTGSLNPDAIISTDTDEPVDTEDSNFLLDTEAFQLTDESLSPAQQAALNRTVAPGVLAPLTDDEEFRFGVSPRDYDTYMTTFENQFDAIDPTAFTDLDLTFDTKEEDYYQAAAPEAYSKFRSLVNRQDELESRLKSLPVSAENYQERALIKDELTGASPGAGGIGQLFGKDIEVQIEEARIEMMGDISKAQEKSKTLESFANEISPTDDSFLLALLDMLDNVNSNTPLHEINQGELREALKSAITAGMMSEEEVNTLYDMLSVYQESSSRYWDQPSNRAVEQMKGSQAVDLSDNFWNLFKVR